MPLLDKNFLPDVDPKAPWSDDELDREDAARRLTTIISSVEQPFVIALTAPFGGGKTFFLRRWEQQLKADGFASLYFNAWETDFAEDPLIAFVAAISEQFRALNVSDKAPSLNGMMQVAGEYALRKAIPRTAELLLKGFVKEAEVKKFIERIDGSEPAARKFFGDLGAKEVADHLDVRKLMGRFKEHLAEASQSATKGGGKLIVLVDELDRCRPDYAISLLEVIKHFFSVEGLVFILAVDEKQLRNTAAAVYGSAIDADAYLRKFVDWTLRIPKPSTERFANHLYKRFGFATLLKERDDIRNGGRTFRAVFADASTLFGLSLRSQEHCFTAANVALRLGAESVPYSIVLAAMVTLSARRPDLYHSLGTGEANYDAALEFIEEECPTKVVSADGLELVRLAFVLAGANGVDELRASEGNLKIQTANVNEKQRPNLERQAATFDRASQIFAESSIGFGLGSNETLAMFTYRLIEAAEDLLPVDPPPAAAAST